MQNTKNQNHQQQLQQQVQLQLQGETQYTVYKDLENFLGILVESNIVCSLLDRDDPLLNIHINRLIAQLNLSKSIHYDTQSTAEDKGTSNQLSDLKKNALNIIQQYLKEQGVQIDGRIEQYFNEYMQILESRQHTLQITNLIPTNRVNNLQEQQINNLLNSMNAVDQDYQRLRKGEQYQLDRKQLFQRIKDRIKVAENKIKSYKQSSTQNYKSKNPNLELLQDQQEKYQDETLTPESIQIIKCLILLSENKKTEDNIALLQDQIKRIHQKRQISNQKQKQNVILETNPYQDRVFKEIQLILSMLNQPQQFKIMASHIQSYFLKQTNPQYEHWKKVFTQKDIDIIIEFISSSKK